MTRINRSLQRTSKRITWTVSVLLALMLILSACGGAAVQNQASHVSHTTTDQTPVKGGTLTVAIEGEPATGLDPHTVSEAVTFEVDANIFDTLVRVSHTGQLKPDLAESWEQSADGLTYTFHLRKDAKFQNGRPVTSEDAAFSLRRILDKATHAPRRSDYASIATIETPDPYTLVVKTKTYDASLLANLANGNAAVVPKEAVGSLAKHPIGSGPFKFVEWVPGSHITLERWDGYWQKDRPYLDKVVFKFISDPATATAALQAGDVDLIARMNAADAVKLKDDPRFTIVSGPQNLPQVLAINTTRKPFQDVRVRQAMAYAINKHEIIQGAAWGYATPIGTNMSPVLSAWYNPATDKVYSYDPAKAKDLLKQAGYPNGFEATLSLPQPYAFHIKTGEIVAQELAKVGIKLNLKIVEWGTWLSQIYRKHDYDLTIIGYAGRLDPAAIVGRYATGNPGNLPQYSNPEVDRLLQEGLQARDVTKRKQIYDQIQMILTRDAPSLFIQDPHILAGMQKNVHGYKLYPVYVIELRDVWKSR